MFQGEEQARRDAHDQRMAEREAKELQSGKRLRGRAPALPEPVKERQANVTDPDSRIMKTQHGFIQGYNGQAVVTEHQIVVACDLAADPTDVGLLHPMLEQAQRNLRTVGVTEPIGVLVADAGYYSDSNASRQTADGPELLIATAKGWRERKAAQAHPEGFKIPDPVNGRHR